MKSRKFLMVIIPLAMVIGLVFAGCGGSDGSDGKSAYEIAVDNGYTGTEAEWVASLASVPVEGEACVICHEGAGEEHQASYEAQLDTDYTLTITDVASTGAGPYDVTVYFSIAMNGTPVDDGNGLPSWPRTNFQVMKYDSINATVDSVIGFDNDDVLSLGGGDYSVMATNQTYAPEATDSAAFIYIAKDVLQSGPGHITLYDDVVSGGWSTGEAINYESPSVVAGCERCHGEPYGKHGYRQAAVTGLADFIACKGCHYDSREGEHGDLWMQLADDPVAWGNDEAASSTLYAYTANVMQDVHQSHAMEFPYPQSMANCVVCHEGKLDMILTDANFTLETCKSCHPVTGDEDYPAMAPALYSVMPTTGLDHSTYIDADYQEANTCNGCHKVGGAGPEFSEIHLGYDPEIYSAEGVKWSDATTVSIDSVSYDALNYDLTIGLSADGPLDVTPAILIGLYGWDTSQYIVNGHDRWDANGNGTISRGDGDPPKGEYVIGEVFDEPNPYWTLEAGTIPGTSWTVTAHLIEWADMIDEDVVRRVGLGILPETDPEVALNAVTMVYDIGADTLAPTPVIADAGKCNACHDALGTTFHSADYGGDVSVCKFCHVTLTGGSHLEMQSRSIDSYVHAIHSMAPFDYGDIDFDDPVEAKHFANHTEEFVYPTFTTRACESCHVAGAYDVPDQSKSLPGVQSASDSNDTRDRAIGDVPEYVTGPASRACGGCHRTMAVNEDNANELAAFNAHVAGNGYLVENDSSDSIFYAIVDKVMSLFN